jgi:hypothetical protein
MATNLAHRMYPSIVGIMFGLFQTGLFFQLAFTLSSSFRTYLMVTICWLIGSAIGIQLARRVSLSQVHSQGLLLAVLMGYFGCALLLHIAPFNTQLWPAYAVLIMITGVYPGVFFVRMGRVYRARDLFFRENNGFIAGIVVATLLFMLLGRGVLWAAPLLLAGLILALPEPVQHRQQSTSTPV